MKSNEKLLHLLKQRRSTGYVRGKEARRNTMTLASRMPWRTMQTRNEELAQKCKNRERMRGSAPDRASPSPPLWVSLLPAHPCS